MKATKVFTNCIGALALVVVTSCNTSKKIVYFQDLDDGGEVQLAQQKVITIQPGDQLSIIVYGDNAELASTFNLSTSSNVSVGSNNDGVSTRAYTVNTKGNIKMPVLGEINVQGKTREEVAETIEQELTTRNLLRNPVVNVAFYNMYISVLGEVGDVTRVPIQKDVLTLPDVLSQCGDLTINGKRENVKVIREVDGKKVAMTVDLRSASNVYQSPAYYLQPNDLVYVEPNGQKTAQSVSNGSAVRTPSFWISIVTFVTSMAFLLLK